MQLIDNKGSVRYGIHKQPVTTVNYTDYKLKTPLGVIVSDAERDKQFKRFQFMGFVSKSLVVGCAMTHTATAQTVFFYIFDKFSGRMIKRGFRCREGDEFAISLSPDDGKSYFASKNVRIQMEAKASTFSKRLEISVVDDIAIDMIFNDRNSDFETLRICTPTGAAGWTFAQKVAGVPALGNLKCEFGHYDLAKDHACAHHDYTAGFLRTETFWNWACITDLDEKNDCVVGANLSNGVNETGFTENAFWIDGKLHKVDAVMFAYDDEDLRQPWRITSFDSTVDLTFTPVDGYDVFSDKPGAESRFDQVFGHFSGRLGAEDAPYFIKELWGFAERQYVVW